MKENILKLLINLIIEFVKQLIEKDEQREKEVANLVEKFKSDSELAENVRRQYPTLSDQAIMKELC